MSNPVGLPHLPGGPSYDDRILGSEILIVDDQQLNRDLLKQVLTKGGYRNISFAEDGITALEVVEAKKPDLVILDILMPRLDGFAVCRALRKNSSFDDLPIIVQTSLDSSDERHEVFEAGASDLIIKPFDHKEVLSRVRLHLQQRLNRQLRNNYIRQMETELAQAKALQVSLLPSDQELAALTEKTGLRCKGYYESSAQMGGDLWGLIPLSDNRVLVYLADFAGHGVVAAMDTFRLHTLMKLGSDSVDLAVPEEVMAWLNDQLKRSLRLGQFATMFLCVIDPETAKLSYAAAAAPPVFIAREKGRIERLDTSGMPLGILASRDFTSNQIAFGPGDCLFAYSDALIESKDHTGQRRFGVDKLENLLKGRWPACNPDDLLQLVLDHFFETHPRPVDDDLTVVTLSSH